MTWTLAELGDATREFPTLVAAGTTGVSGTLLVCGAMLGGSLILNPSEENLSDREVQASFLVDSFQVEIGCKGDEPFLKVLGTRLADTAARYGKKLIDLHAYSDHSVCFAAPQQLMSEPPSAMTPVVFIRRYALPFLYEQAYFDRHGIWPWGELAHGVVGLIEWLSTIQNPTGADVMRTLFCLEVSGEEAKKLIQKRARWHHKCPCASGKQTRNCHPGYKRSVDMIRSWLAQGNSPRHRKLIIPSQVPNEVPKRVSPE